ELLERVAPVDGLAGLRALEEPGDPTHDLELGGDLVARRQQEEDEPRALPVRRLEVDAARAVADGEDGLLEPLDARVRDRQLVAEARAQRHLAGPDLAEDGVRVDPGGLGGGGAELADRLLAGGALEGREEERRGEEPVELP